MKKCLSVFLVLLLVVLAAGCETVSDPGASSEEEIREYTLTVIDGIGSGTYHYGDTAVISPDWEKCGDLHFLHWTVGDEILSEYEDETILITSDMTVKAMYMSKEEYIEKYGINYAEPENFFNRLGKAVWEKAEGGVRVTVKDRSNRVEIKTGMQDKAAESGYYLQFKFRSAEITEFCLGGTNYNGGRNSKIAVNLTGNTDKAIITPIENGFYLIQIKITDLPHTGFAADEYAMRFYDFGSVGSFVIRDFHIAPLRNDPVFAYVFKGDEKDLPSYGEGTIRYVDAAEHTGEECYELYFGNSKGKLPGYAPLAVKKASDSSDLLRVDLGENAFIPFDADRLVVYKSSDDTYTYESVYAELQIDRKKLQSRLNAEVKFASVSDIHMNYNQGKELWIHALQEYQKENIDYVIISGDIGESSADYLIYKDACEKSGYKGLIFSCIGNHDQTAGAKAAFPKYAIYDGSASAWVPLSEAAEYFKNTYKGKIPVTVLYADKEGNGNTCYYTATIGDNMFFFMDQMLAAAGGSSAQDNFSAVQVDYLAECLEKYRKTHKLFIIEHAPIQALRVGYDINAQYYGESVVVKKTFPNNTRFKALLNEYTEAVWMSGHTHLGFGVALCYADKEFGTNIPIAHSIHNSSTAQTRELVDGTIAYGTDYRSASQGYICYQFGDSMLVEGHIYKFRTVNPKLEPETLTNQIDATTSFYFKY